MFGSVITWIEQELVAAGVGDLLVKKVLPIVVMDLLAHKSKEQILADLLGLFRDKQL